MPLACRSWSTSSVLSPASERGSGFAWSDSPTWHVQKLFLFSRRCRRSQRGRSVHLVELGLRVDAPGKLGPIDALVGAVDTGALHVLRAPQDELRFGQGGFLLGL